VVVFFFSFGFITLVRPRHPLSRAGCFPQIPVGGCFADMKLGACGVFHGAGGGGTTSLGDVSLSIRRH